MLTKNPILRLKILGLLGVALLSVLVFRLGYVQILSDTKYQVQASTNIRQRIPEPAPRGRILDINGKVLVGNKIIIPDIDSDQPEQFGGIQPLERMVRSYPYKNTAAHLLGYVGPISQQDLTLLGSTPIPYLAVEEIGKTGIELAFENDLRGTPGYREVLMDANFNILEEISYTPPIAGKDIQLTIDIEIQQLLEQELAQGLKDAQYPAEAGAAVILDTSESQVLAMASYPTYEPEKFVSGISQESFLELAQEASNAPLINRVIQGVYSPGSSMKPITAFSALSSGLIGDDGHITVTEKVLDEGTITLEDCTGKCEFSNPGQQPRGSLDLREAIAISSDVYFYKLVREFEHLEEYDSDQIQQTARLLGFGKTTGIALPYELSGLVPTRDDPTWVVGDTINVAIGQGDLGVTPLQLANAYTAIANGGFLYAPKVVSAVRESTTGEIVRTFAPRLIRQIPMPDEIRAPIVDGMLGAITRNVASETPGIPDQVGTAYSAFLDFPHHIWQVAGKTGTVEAEGREDTAVFVAFAPNPEPEYVMVAILEESGFGGISAAPVIRRVMEALALK